MKLDWMEKIESSFLSCGKDTKRILKRLFVDNREYSEKLKRLLVVNTPDCLDTSKYQKDIENMDVAALIKNGYIRTTPKIRMPEHEEVKAYILLSFDNFTPSENPQFRDNIVTFDIVCHTDYWNINDFVLRPLEIAGYIDGLLHDTKLTGIGTFQFFGCDKFTLSEEISGYSLSFSAVHGSDDRIPDKEEE